MKTALLIVDMQENLLDPDSKMHIDVNTIPGVIKKVNDMVIDFERRKMPVFYVVNEFTNPLMNLITRNVCKKGAQGTGLHPLLKRVNQDLYHKSANDAFTNQRLLEELKNSGVTEVCVVGVFAEHCVKATVASAIRHNFRVSVIAGGVGGRSERSREKALKVCLKKGAQII
jgi:nicotinamidase-related amidase